MRVESLRLVFMPQAEVVAATRACETEVFHDRHHVTPAEMAGEYGPYEDSSVWLSVVDHRDDVLAGCRLIPPNPGGLKSVADIGKPPWSLDGAAVVSAARLDLSRTWDVATLFRRRGTGAAPMTAALFHGIIMAIRQNDGNAAVANLDAVVRALLERGFGVRWHTMPGATRQWYIGGLSDPVYVFIADLLAHSRRVHPIGHRMYAYGDGLDGIDLPRPEDFRIRRAVVDVREPRPASVREDVLPVGTWGWDVRDAG